MSIDRLSASAGAKLQRLKQPAADAQPLKRAQVGVFDGALEQRIAAAFGKTSSSDVAALIAEVENAVVVRSEAAEGARLQALNPALRPADVAAARRQMEDAAFKRDRMQEAVRRLAERLREVRAQEEQARRRAAYDAALAERDRVAAELAEVYPPLAAKLADLAALVAANDSQIERVNRELPNSSKRIDSAELIARQLNNFVNGPSNIPRITWHMRLPAFKCSGHDPYVWPRPS